MGCWGPQYLLCDALVSARRASPGVGLRYYRQALGGLMVAALSPEANRDDYGAFFPRPSAGAIC